MGNYKVVWDNGHSSGTLPKSFTSIKAAEKYARQWKRDMVNAEDPSTRAEARAAYSWEVVDVPPEKPKRIDAQTPTTTHDDGQFVRTALIVADSKAGSVVVGQYRDGKFVRLGLINIFVIDDAKQDCLMVDVIDIDERYTERRALVFNPTTRNSLDVPPGGNLVASHFERSK